MGLMGNRPWLIWVALATAGVLLVTATPHAGYVPVVLWLIAFCLAAAIVARVFAVKKRDPYDLNLLREIHEKEEVASIVVPDVMDDAGVVCPHCGERYSAVFPCCPQCKL